MPIRRADELSFSPPRRCPVCNVGVLPYGHGQPIAVDGAGNMYCRDHGVVIEPGYTAALQRYSDETRSRRLAAIRALESTTLDDGDTASESAPG